MAQRLTPETKTVRYMVHGMGLTACRASSRFGKLSFDLFGFVDVVGFKPRLCVDPELGTVNDGGPVPFLFVQATSSDHQANRQSKILDSPTLRLRAFGLHAGGHRVDVWGWVRGRRRDTEAFHCFELRGRSPAGLVFHDRGIVEVPGELLAPLR